MSELTLYRFAFSCLDESASFMVDVVAFDADEAKGYVDEYVKEKGIEVGGIVPTDTAPIKNGILTTWEFPAEIKPE